MAVSFSFSYLDLHVTAQRRLYSHSFLFFLFARYLEARRKKNKKAKTDGVVDFPGREKIKFGEVVEAPPKLSVPKVIFWSSIVSLCVIIK